MSDELTGPYHGPTPPPTPGARFAPGELLSGRYRVVAPLGKGGMGEVYRADDLALGQAVALKFLPAPLASDPDRLARFRKEVATARQVSHPNVCRVYDLGEHHGQLFLAMEYIDGEDLASLLRRVGRLPEEKGVEIARQLCLALAAVHEQGLLHRDLKPPNVMLDGRGRVRLTDFGLAAAAADISATEVRSGTPAYQAPEQLRGESVSVQSDLFALGLVLYEVLTGRRAFPAATREELAKAYESGAPSKPSSHVGGLSPAVERALLRCLEKDPKDRPRSAYEVVAGLPGGDPLAAALARGETPSPQMVAEGGAVGTLRPAVGALLLALVAAGLVLAAVLNDSWALFRRLPPPQPPEELERKARDLLDRLGYPDRPADAAGHFRVDTAYLEHVTRNDPSPHRWDSLRSGRPAATYFFYRESPEPLVPGLVFRGGRTSPEPAGLVTPANPPLTRPGMASVRLDGQGRLLELAVVPAPGAGDAADAAIPWRPLLEAADLPDDLEPGQPRWVPPVPCDRREARDGAFPGRPELPLHVEAATFAGKPVFFRAGGDWTAPASSRPEQAAVVRTIMVGGLALFAGILLLALRNLRRGRGDRRGAIVLGGVLAAGNVAVWLLGGHHTGSGQGEFFGLMTAIGSGVWVGSLAALAYLAIEPAVRRRWPWRLTAWSRVLAGRLRDPLVGRDLLVGLLAGLVLYAILHVFDAVPEFFGVPPRPPWFTLWLGADIGPPAPRAWVLDNLFMPIPQALGAFTLVFLLALVLRRERLAWAGFVVLSSLQNVIWFTSPSPLGVPSVAVATVVFFGVEAFVMARFGLWAYAVACITKHLLVSLPLTGDTAAWYFGQGLLVALLLVGVAAYGFVTAAHGQRLFQGGFFGDE